MSNMLTWEEPEECPEDNPALEPGDVDDAENRLAPAHEAMMEAHRKVIRAELDVMGGRNGHMSDVEKAKQEYAKAKARYEAICGVLSL